MSSALSPLSADISAYCANIGADPLIVQGAGGNVSWKDADALWIKASGLWLSDANRRDVFVPVDLADLQQSIRLGNFDTKPKVLGEHSLKPSIETLLHALMPHKIVVHLHLVEALSHLVRDEGLKTISLLLGNSLNWRSVGYRKPGAELAEAVALAINTCEDPHDLDVVFLISHGVVIGGDTIDDIDRKLQLLISRLALPVMSLDVAGRKPLLAESPSGYIELDSPYAQKFVTNGTLFDRLARDWALFPDHVVFLGGYARTFDSREAFFDAIGQAESFPELVFIRNCGIYVTDTFSEAKHVQLQCYFDVMLRQPFDMTLHSLNSQEIGALLNWDAEQYRMALNR